MGDKPMRAMRLHHPATLHGIRMGSAEPQEPGPGEIMVRVRANSLNFRDYIVATGYLPSRDGAILLSDCAGDVAQVGPGVDGFRVGDRVVSTFHPAWLDGDPDAVQPVSPPGAITDGFACDYATRPAAHFTHAPSGLTHAQAATLTCAGVTAWRALADGPVGPGSTVLVLGSGGVSVFALQFAKAAGARVIATSSSDAKLGLLRQLGADHVINYTNEADWERAVIDMTDGRGVDQVIEVGGPTTLPHSLAAVRVGGHVAIIGAVGGFEGGIPFAVVQAKRLRLQGVTVGSRRNQTDMIRAIEANGIVPVVARTFSLESLAEAFRFQQQEAPVGKVCLEL